MSSSEPILAAGVDVGTECVKAVVAEPSGRIRGRAATPTRGYFEACVEEVLRAACDEAGVARDGLAAVCATGFGGACVPEATFSVSETACHARGAFEQIGREMTLVDVGGREPRAIHVGPRGRRLGARSVRKCAVGIGTFLMFAARHLDVHPTRLQELAASAETPAPISSYCSVFAGSEILERLRDGFMREEVALGCMHSIAERIFELGDLDEPVVFTGGVPAYFPGVARSLERLCGIKVEIAPAPIYTGALGAVLLAIDRLEGRAGREEEREEP